MDPARPIDSAITDERRRREDRGDAAVDRPSGPHGATVEVSAERWRADGTPATIRDALVVEAPLEYRVHGEPIATVMRTPGDDGDLAVGYFLCEGWIRGPADLAALCLGDRAVEQGGTFAAIMPTSIADLRLVRGGPPPAEPARRVGPIVASCGVCGKQTVEEILATLPHLASDSDDTGHRAAARAAFRVDSPTLLELPERLRAGQAVFDRTGALHAAGVFDADGRALVIREDIGRHNAVDKAIGALVRGGVDPLDRHVLVVSGRASFEIVQKALVAGIAFVVAVSGVSGLARDLAARAGMTLCGFARERAATVYTHPHRLDGGRMLPDDPGR